MEFGTIFYFQNFKENLKDLIVINFYQLDGKIEDPLMILSPLVAMMKRMFAKKLKSSS